MGSIMLIIYKLTVKSHFLQLNKLNNYEFSFTSGICTDMNVCIHVTYAHIYLNFVKWHSDKV